jgi:hypothetical protein
MTHSKGISWIDDCRIPFVDERDFSNSIGGVGSIFGNIDTGKGEKIIPNTRGRFPANLLVCDDMLNDGVISKSGKNKIRTSDGFGKNAYGKGIGVKAGQNNGDYGDKGTNSRYYDIDKWFDKIISE